MSFKTNLRACIAIAALCISTLAGCRSYGPTDLVPAADVLNRSCCNPSQEQQINFLNLRRTPPEQYVLSKGDVLGIYIQGITGDAAVPPPVNFADQDSQPAIGYPVPIRDDGYISLPLIAPLRVIGLTVGEAEAKIIRAYTQDKKILLEGNEKIIVTLMQRRTYNVLVIREDGGTISNSNRGLNRNEIYLDEGLNTESFSIELPAYENDVLHALSETGGMPGETAKNEIVILRGAMNGSQNPGAIVQAIGASHGNRESRTLEGANVVRIPIRGDIGSFPKLSEADITLEDGDVVFIEGRPRDVFYTGGLLEGGRFPLPRDYDIDVLEAMAMTGGSVSASAGSGGNGSFTGIGNILPATQVTILRKCGCEQVAIDVDLRYALAEPCERVIVQPGDLIILEYRKNELFTNSFVSIFQFGGIFNLFR